jgi:sodium pump decarboxylase gamma subunit
MLASNLENISIGEAGVLALLGYAVVFFGLILLMCVIMIMGKLFVSAEKKKSAKAESAKSGVTAAAVPAAIPQEAPVAQPAPGTAGQLKLYDTPPKTAAMIMAIVADQMGKPLNELRFISIKEVK